MQRLNTFFQIWTWFSFRQLRKHFGRTLVVLVGIGLGAAVFTSVRLAVNASLDSFTKSVDLLSGKADWTVSRPGGRVPETLLPMLINHPDVEALSVLSTTYVQIQEGVPDSFLLIGIDPVFDRSLRSWKANPVSSNSTPEIRNPRSESSSLWLELIKEPFTLISGEKLAERLRPQTEKTVTLDHSQGRRTFRLLGTLTAEGLALVDGGQIALTDIATFQEFTGTYGYVDRIDVLLKPKASISGRDSLRAALPPGIILAQPSELKESGRLMVR